MVLFCIFLMTSVVEHLFMCVFAIIYLLGWCVSSCPLPIFWLNCSFYCWVWDFFMYSKYNLVKVDVLTMLSLPIQEHYLFLYLFRSYSVSFFSVAQCSACKFCSCFAISKDFSLNLCTWYYIFLFCYFLFLYANLLSCKLSFNSCWNHLLVLGDFVDSLGFST